MIKIQDDKYKTATFLNFRSKETRKEFCSTLAHTNFSHLLAWNFLQSYSWNNLDKIHVCAAFSYYLPYIGSVDLESFALFGCFMGLKQHLFGVFRGLKYGGTFLEFSGFLNSQNYAVSGA